MTNFHETAPRPDLTPEIVLGDLCVWTTMQLADAWETGMSDPINEWVTRGTADTLGGGRVPTLWYRLAETMKITDEGQERFDVGMPVDAKQRWDENPVADISEGFFIRLLRPEVIRRVDLSNVLRYAGVEAPDSDTLVTDLQVKLKDYYPQPIKVKAKPRNPAA